MLDVNFIRENPEAVKEGVEKKKVDKKLVDKFLQLDTTWRGKVKAIDELKSEQNALSKELAKEQKEDLMGRAQLLKQRISELEGECVAAETKRKELLNRLPNIPFPDVPVGKDETENKALREVGEKPKFDFTPKDYLSLAEGLGIINTKKASEVSGSRFGYLVGDMALLELGIVRLAFDMLTKEGFVPILPPVMIKPDVYAGMGRLAADQKEERYYFPKDELYLIGSAEHTMGPYHLNETFDDEDLPRRYVGFSTCFRREAGSYGKDTKGIFRVHQFDKVEMYSFVHPEKSGEEHLFLLSLQEKLMQALKIPYRVMEICTGDMGWTDARQFDIEAWFPSEERYRETHSCSNTTNFQARGINVKYKTKEGKKEYVHTLNATAFSQRPLLALLENYQTKEGTIKIPEAIQNYLGKKEIKK